MKKSILALVVSSVLVGCGGSGSGNDTTTEDWTNHDRKDDTNTGEFVCTIVSPNGPGAEPTSNWKTPTDQHGNFFGDSITFEGDCKGGGYQITEWTWTVEDEPTRSTARLFHEGTKQGGVPDNTLQFWYPGAQLIADGKYVVSLYATNSQGVDSAKVYFELEYLAANYLSGSYVEENPNLVLEDTDRPYFVAGPVIAKNIDIGPGVSVYSSGCNGWEETGYGCEMTVHDSFTIRGTAQEPVEIFSGVIRASDDWPASFTATHTKFDKGMINYNKLNTQMWFANITIDHSTFKDHYGIVLTGNGDSITDSSFTNTGHEFTLDNQKAAISIIDAENVYISYNTFYDSDKYAVGISADVTEVPDTDFYVTNNVYRMPIDDAIFDGYDATYESHGDNLSYVTTIIAN